MVLVFGTVFTYSVTVYRKKSICTMESFIIYSVYVEYGKPSAHFLLIMYTSMETIVDTQGCRPEFGFSRPVVLFSSIASVIGTVRVGAGGETRKSIYSFY
jgi:hypothetical protein